MNNLEEKPEQSSNQATDADIQQENQKPKARHRPLPMVFFGTSASFSHNVLKNVLKNVAPATLDIRAIFCDASEPYRPERGFDLHKLDPSPPFGGNPSLDPHEIRLHTDPSFDTANIIDIGWKYNIPVYSVGRIGSKAVANTLAALDLELAMVACFNKRIPKSLLEIPKLGFLNLHPSMLPKYRGPEPIQWILHDGAQGGVTIHWMDESFDTGDIALQREIDLLPGTTYLSAEKTCAVVGANLYLELFIEIIQGNIPRTPQGKDGFYRPRLGFIP